MGDGAAPLDSGRLDSFPCQGELLALYETLVNVMFCAKDADGVYLEVNTAFVRRTGRASKREVIGRRVADLFAPERAARYEEQDRHVLAGEGALRDELELIRRPDGELGWYLTTKLPVSGSDEGAAPIGLVSVSRDLQTPTTDGETVASLQPVVTHVREHLQEPLRVADLAAVADCTPSQLDRRLKRVFGLSPKQYVLRVKVERAMTLLTETDADLADIAHLAGFYDQPDFSRRFARVTGRTPAQFRASSSDLIGS
ncbi:MAG: AraC family transcriptional regulator [Actinomycetota bacterium]